MSNLESEEIREQMARIRRELHDDVDAVVENAKDFADWRNFVRRYPILSAAGAAAIGFMIVPNRLHVMSPDASTLEKLAKSNRLVVKPQSEVRKQSGMIAPMVGLIASAVLRNGITMAGQHFGKLLESDANVSQGANFTSGTFNKDVEERP